MEYKCPEKIHYINSWFILPLNKWILYGSHTMTFARVYTSQTKNSPGKAFRQYEPTDVA